MWQHVLILGAHGVCFPHGHHSSVEHRAWDSETPVWPVLCVGRRGAAQLSAAAPEASSRRMWPQHPHQAARGITRSVCVPNKIK